jgi:hypothetical protein
MGKAKDEVEELRKQVELLTAQAAKKDEVQEQPEEKEPAEEGADLSHLRVKLDEFMGTLKRDLDEIPAGTAVGIFALGVLMGRLLPR